MKLAEIITESLFTNGAGQKAKRLVLELENGKDGGGLCKEAVVGVIERELADQQPIEPDLVVSGPKLSQGDYPGGCLPPR